LSRSPASFIKYFATCSNQRLNINFQQSSLNYSCLLLATKGQQNQLRGSPQLKSRACLKSFIPGH
jgi:hypothetical protein